MDDDLNNAELLAVSSANAMNDLANRMSNPKLMALRAQNPFLVIGQFPNEAVGVLLAAGIPQDINLPAGTKMIRFTGNCDYYVSRKGNAQIPDGTANTRDSGAIYKPEGIYYYAEEIKQLSIVGPAVGIVTVNCFVQL